MLVLACKIHHLGDFGLGHLIGVDAADADALVVHVQHDAGRLFPPLVEEALQHVHDELHRRVVVIQQQDLVEADGFLVFGRVLVMRPVLPSPSSREPFLPAMRRSLSMSLSFASSRRRMFATATPIVAILTVARQGGQTSQGPGRHAARHALLACAPAEYCAPAPNIKRCQIRRKKALGCRLSAPGPLPVARPQWARCCRSADRSSDRSGAPSRPACRLPWRVRHTCRRSSTSDAYSRRRRAWRSRSGSRWPARPT